MSVTSRPPGNERVVQKRRHLLLVRVKQQGGVSSRRRPGLAHASQGCFARQRRAGMPRWVGTGGRLSHSARIHSLLRADRQTVAGGAQLSSRPGYHDLLAFAIFRTYLSVSISHEDGGSPPPLHAPASFHSSNMVNSGSVQGSTRHDTTPPINAQTTRHRSFK